MKKIIKSMDGFAMAELLTVSLIIVMLFSVLFANFLPLVGEYENRTSYNSVTAEYAAFQLRKIYNQAYNTPTGKSKIDAAINSKGFLSVYNDTNKTTVEGKQVIVSPLVEVLGLVVTSPAGSEEEDDDERVNPYVQDVMDIINGYDIKEIIITKYVLAGSRAGAKPLKTSYQRGIVEGEGEHQLYNYVQYLPTYANSRYATAVTITDPLRIIVRTGSYGYATMQIQPDPPTDINCFILTPTTGRNGNTSVSDDQKIYYYANNTNYKVGRGWLIKSFRKKMNGCSDPDIYIGEQVITKDGHTGPIVGIVNKDATTGRGVFAASNITGINFPKTFTFIGSKAFYNNHIEELDLTDDGSGLFYVGDEAFANNHIKNLSIPISDIAFGRAAFKNNTELASVEFLINNMPNPTTGYVTSPLANSIQNSSGGVIPQSIVISESMFENTKSNAEPLDLKIPLVTKAIEDNAFNGTKINSVEFVSEVPVATGSDAGEVIEEEDGDDADSQTNLISIGKNAFLSRTISIGQDNKGPDLDISIPYTVTAIGDRAFANSKIRSITFEGLDVEDKNDPKASKLNSIGVDAFSIDPAPESGEGDFNVGRCSMNKTHTFETGEETTRMLNIPSSVQTIKDRAFNCLYMDDVILESIDSSDPNKAQTPQLTTVGAEAFSTNFYKASSERGDFENTNGMSLSDYVSFNFSNKMIKITKDANNKNVVNFSSLGKKIFGDSYQYIGFGSLRGGITVSEKGAIDFANVSGNPQQLADKWCDVLYGSHESCSYYKTSNSDPDDEWIASYLELYGYVMQYRALPPIDTPNYVWLDNYRRNPQQLGNSNITITMKEYGRPEDEPARVYRLKKSQFLDKINVQGLITNNINGTKWNNSVDEPREWASYYEKLRTYVNANNGYGNLDDESKLPANSDLVFLSQWYVVQKEKDNSCKLNDVNITINGTTKLKSVWLSELQGWEGCSGEDSGDDGGPGDGDAPDDELVEDDSLTYVIKQGNRSVYISYASNNG